MPLPSVAFLIKSYYYSVTDETDGQKGNHHEDA